MDDMEFNLTKEEKYAIRTLEKLSKRWPKSLWLYSASGILNVMRKGDNGDAVLLNGRGYDQDYSIVQIEIENDGGDW